MPTNETSVTGASCVPVMLNRFFTCVMTTLPSTGGGVPAEALCHRYSVCVTSSKYHSAG